VFERIYHYYVEVIESGGVKRRIFGNLCVNGFGRFNESDYKKAMEIISDRYNLADEKCVLISFNCL
jgi:hypothetical protein